MRRDVLECLTAEFPDFPLLSVLAVGSLLADTSGYTCSHALVHGRAGQCTAMKEGEGRQSMGSGKSQSLVTFRCIFVMEFCDAGARTCPTTCVTLLLRDLLEIGRSLKSG